MSGVVDTTGANSGTIGTTNTSSAVDLLYSSAIVSGVSCVNIDGYFNDKVYGHYRLFVSCMQGSVDGNNPILKAMVSGSVSTSTDWWSTCYGSYGSNGTEAVQTRADNDGANHTNLNATWQLTDSAAFSSNHEIIFANPQNSKHKHFSWQYWGDAHGTNETFVVHNWGFSSWKDSTALTGIAYCAAGGNLASGRISLYGWKHNLIT